MSFIGPAIGAGAGFLAADALGVGLGTAVLGGAFLGGSLGGQMTQANAARDAANAQVGAANNATALRACIQ